MLVVAGFDHTCYRPENLLAIRIQRIRCVEHCRGAHIQSLRRVGQKLASDDFHSFVSGSIEIALVCVQLLGGGDGSDFGIRIQGVSYPQAPESSYKSLDKILVNSRSDDNSRSCRAALSRLKVRAVDGDLNRLLEVGVI